MQNVAMITKLIVTWDKKALTLERTAAHQPFGEVVSSAKAKVYRECIKELSVAQGRQG